MFDTGAPVNMVANGSQKHFYCLKTTPEMSQYTNFDGSKK